MMCAFFKVKIDKYDRTVIIEISAAKATLAFNPHNLKLYITLIRERKTSLIHHWVLECHKLLTS